MEIGKINIIISNFVFGIFAYGTVSENNMMNNSVVQLGEENPNYEIV